MPRPSSIAWAWALLYGAVAREGLEIRKIALPLMERLRDLTGVNAILHELRDCQRVCIEK
jgi:DNA-binding IclR family transcriptional regulator